MHQDIILQDLTNDELRAAMQAYDRAQTVEDALHAAALYRELVRRIERGEWDV